MERAQVEALVQQGQVHAGAHAHEPDGLAFHLQHQNTATYQTQNLPRVLGMWPAGSVGDTLGLFKGGRVFQ